MQKYQLRVEAGDNMEGRRNKQTKGDQKSLHLSELAELPIRETDAAMKIHNADFLKRYGNERKSSFPPTLNSRPSKVRGKADSLAWSKKINLPDFGHVSSTWEAERNMSKNVDLIQQYWDLVLLEE